MFSMICILVFINGANSNGGSAIWDVIYKSKYIITGVFAVILLYALVK